MPIPTIQQPTPVCPACQSKAVVKKGRRKNRLHTVALYQCAGCLHRFTGEAGKYKTYSLKTILTAISTYNTGHSLTETQRILRRRLHLDIPERTISSWLTEYKILSTYSRLRASARRLFSPETILRTKYLEHRQVYVFQAHQAKLDLLIAASGIPGLERMKEYFRKVETDFPHRIFKTGEHRSSKFPTELHLTVTRKENNATRLAALALPTSPNNRKRHETLQRFMLLNDSVTVAVEIPVYLTKEDIAYYRGRGFNLGFDADVITGHIDFLQIRNGFLHILDYKPDARKEKHAHVQLTIYALALARRTALPVKFFKCAWFDEKDYFEFFPLQGVYSSSLQSSSA